MMPQQYVPYFFLESAASKRSHRQCVQNASKNSNAEKHEKFKIGGTKFTRRPKLPIESILSLSSLFSCEPAPPAEEL
jgi:hypothetical protein